LNDTRTFDATAATAFVQQTCLPNLRESQNNDGGWGFGAGQESRTEPTAWALLALSEFSAADETDRAISGAVCFLERSQLVDGSWPAAAGVTNGSWVTSLACWALSANRKSSASRARGLRWLEEQTPGDSGLWWRLMRWLATGRNVSAQSDSLYGWSWTPGTASWVEPTSYALIVLRSLPEKTLLPKTSARLKVAEEMLYDRMCPGGGWNCGNPMVYGVAGEPQVGPTVWALLALRENPTRPEIEKSLNWLEKNSQSIESPASYARSNIALRVFGRQNPASSDALRALHEQKDIPWSIPETAWAALSMSLKQQWIRSSSQSRNQA
jgi:hypothetical protein